MRDQSTGTPDSREQPPLLRVVRGNPTDEELAALVAVIAARGAAAAVTSAGVRSSGWTDRSRGLRGSHRPGPSGWRFAAHPR